ncbi:hypothetical protein FA13DRAFT_1393588 [Coprinellus micaceus]|uniref:Uncharacterized protein n=1 Tax=Coprinellus micaceus TaxID=71717 RepID=A0A4Y7SRZ5_COPMI|nr:hypothetical protein FA13DRAFT_1393588 [Coprinellus micaceus]
MFDSPSGCKASRRRGPTGGRRAIAVRQLLALQPAGPSTLPTLALKQGQKHRDCVSLSEPERGSLRYCLGSVGHDWPVEEDVLC